MKNFQKTVLALALLTLAGCSLNRPAPALAFPNFKAPLQPSRKTQRRQPLQLHLPETETQPSTIVNIYEGHEVETSGAAEVRHHPNGMEIIPAPSVPKPITPPTPPAPQTRSIPSPPKIASPAEDQDGTFWFNALIALGCSAVVFTAGYIARRPIINTVKNADLSDGVGDEARELVTEVPQELWDQFREFMEWNEAEPEPEPKSKPKPKPRATKKEAAT